MCLRILGRGEELRNLESGDLGRLGERLGEFTAELADGCGRWD